MDNGGYSAFFGRLKNGKKRYGHLDFSENRGGWGNKKAAEKRLMFLQKVERIGVLQKI